MSGNSYDSYTAPRERKNGPQTGSRTRTENPVQRMARKPDLDAVPSGWDLDVWHLALLFEQLAEGWRISLTAGRPVIYARLEHRINSSKIREATERQRTDSHGAVRSWRDLAQAMVTEYWTQSRNERNLGVEPWDEHALDDFVSPEMFRRMGKTVRERATNRRLLSAQKEASK